jgi:uncharacterized protein (TIGR02588 family)
MTGGVPSAASLAEKMAAGFGALLFAGTLAFLGYKEQTLSSSPPDVVLHVEHIQRVHSGFLVTIRAANQGGHTAAGLLVSGVLKDGDTVVEQRHAHFQYVPAESERRGGLYFMRDPRHFTLSLRPEGFERP